jgi:hypothetical protein
MDKMGLNASDHLVADIYLKPNLKVSSASHRGPKKVIRKLE